MTGTGREGAKATTTGEVRAPVLLAAIRRQAVEMGAATWPALGVLVDDRLSDPLAPFSLLPLCSGLACGASADQLTPVAAAVTLAALALRIVDDCADGDNPNALYLKIGLGRAVNGAAALSMAALQALMAIPLSAGAGGESATNALQNGYVSAFLRVCAGQDRDLRQDAHSLEAYCDTVLAKTVAAFEFACWAGARCASEDEALLARAQSCGKHLGWMVQMLDDIEALWFPDGPTDLELGRLTFPVLYGLRMQHPATPTLATLCRKRPYDAPPILALLDEMEVRRHLMTHALDHRDQALDALGPPLDGRGRALLETGLTWIFRDGERLLGK